MILDFPTRVGVVDEWATRFGLSVAEARRRLAQGMLLAGIVQDERLSQHLVFKGGNALDFVWLPNRSTTDLDFSVPFRLGVNQFTEDELSTTFQEICDVASHVSGGYFKLNSIRQEPPGADRSFAALSVRIAYALSDELRLAERLRNGGTGNQVLDLEISSNESICATQPIQIAGTGSSLLTATVDDIVAEKLRAILQQTIRNRSRRQDVLDIAVIQTSGPGCNVTLVSQFLLTKCLARSVTCSKAAFRNAQVRERARIGYDDLATTTRRTFIQFDLAWNQVQSLVDQLDIPQT